MCKTDMAEPAPVFGRLLEPFPRRREIPFFEMDQPRMELFRGTTVFGLSKFAGRLCSGG